MDYAPDGTPPPPPDDLSERAAAFWTSWLADRDDEGNMADARDLAVLVEIVRHMTLIDRLEDELTAAPLTVAGSRGQTVINPMIGQVDTLRRTVGMLLKSITPVDRAAIGSANVARRYQRTPR